MVQAKADWQQALDANLVQRLWRPARQPGLINPRQAHGILARHNNMLPNSSLADALNGRANIGLEAGAGGWATTADCVCAAKCACDTCDRRCQPL